VNGSIHSTEVERFRYIIGERLGLQFEDGKLDLLADVLRRRVEIGKLTCGTYLDQLAADRTGASLRAIAPELTVAETYFFRHFDQLRAYADVALADRIRVQAAHRQLHILSAGCASGEEAYSLAILAREAVADPAWKLSILGIDINPNVLEKASRARFSPWALRETPADLQHRWFRENGREYALDEAVRGSVIFEERNLLEDDPAFWQPEIFDIVFCRNVIMYFTPDGAREVVGRLARSIAPGGYLFLGHAENLRGLSNEFHLKHTDSAFYYQRKSTSDPTGRAVSAYATPLQTLPRTDVAVLVDEADTWIDAIRSSSERIRDLSESGHLANSDERVAPGTGAVRWGLGMANELLKLERFSEALEVVQAFPPESGFDPEVLLLKAVLLTHTGQLPRAEEACRQLLALDEMNAGAHYLLALCREGVKDNHGAADHDRTAAYLDPQFAMPRLHLGLLARRVGDLGAAQRELGLALSLLQREDPSRQLLFGGGFSREALIALCRAEILACGGAQ
jgi:chemotaxis protein methyltransferase CheR